MSLDALTRRNTYATEPLSPGPPKFVEATIVSDAASATDLVHFRIDAEDSLVRAGLARFLPRAGAAGPLLPHRDDPALVVISDQGRAHIVWWEPA